MNINSLKRKLRKVILGYDIPTYFFSKSGEDAILYNIFYPKLASGNRGFYIDVGAHHYSFQSNTFLFYKRGWSGINIDANPHSIQSIRKKRKRDINLNVGVGLSHSKMLFYILQKGYETMNSFSIDNLKALNIEDKIADEVEVEIKPLSVILEENLKSGQEIDFLDVDVEGMDLEVLQSNDWTRFRPKIVLTESDKRTLPQVLNSSVYHFMKSVGYELIAKTSFISSIGTLFFEDQEKQ